jgi:uncharacterized repeat protein (TIGR02543 family)
MDASSGGFLGEVDGGERYLPPLFSNPINILDRTVVAQSTVQTSSGRVASGTVFTAPNFTRTNKPEYGDFYTPDQFPGITLGGAILFVYGGVNVNGESARLYMYEYVKPFIGYNEVFIANDNQVDGRASFDWALSNSQYAGSPSGAGPVPPQTKVLYMFSGGQLPCQALMSDIDLFSKIYLVDPYLKNSFDFYFPIIQSRPEKFVFVYTPDTYENGMSPEQRQAIQNTGVEYEYISSTGLSAHMSTNEKAVQHLLRANLINAGEITAETAIQNPHQQQLVVHTGALVPNVLQVLGYEYSCFYVAPEELVGPEEAGLTPTTPQAENIYLATYANDYPILANVILAGTNPAAQRQQAVQQPRGKTVTHGFPYGELAVPAFAGTQTGYSFVGWYTAAGGTGTEVTAQTIVTIASDHTIYAHWLQVTQGVTSVP